MRKMMGPLLKGQQGNAVVLVALAITVLMGFAALVVDVGMSYVTKSRLQNLADAAALAGGSQLTDSYMAEEEALNYASINGFPGSRAEVAVQPGGRRITVEAKSVVSFFFARLMGWDSHEVLAEATARVEPITGVYRSEPLGIEEHDLVLGARYTLKQGSNGSGKFEALGSGNFGILSLGGGGTSRYEENLKNSYRELIRVGDVLETETGLVSNPTRRALQTRLASCPDIGCDQGSISPRCRHVIIIPIYLPLSYDSSGQVKTVEVRGFAAFYVEAVEGQGTNNIVYGYFVDYKIGGLGDPDQSNYGLATVYLES